MKDSTIESRILSDKVKASVCAMLPPHISVELFMESCLLYIKQEASISSCREDSIVAALLAAAQVGLIPNRQTRHAYFVAVKNECQFFPGYRGIIDLCYRSGFVKSIGSRIVYNDDQFEFEYGTSQYLKHVVSKDPAPDRVMVSAYCIVEMKDTPFFEVRSKNQLDQRKMKCSPESTWFWNNYYEEMCMNEVLKITLKTVPLSPSIQQAVGFSDLFEYGELQRTTDKPEPDLAKKKKSIEIEKSSMSMTGNLISKINANKKN